MIRCLFCPLRLDPCCYCYFFLIKQSCYLPRHKPSISKSSPNVSKKMQQQTITAIGCWTTMVYTQALSASFFLVTSQSGCIDFEADWMERRTITRTTTTAAVVVVNIRIKTMSTIQMFENFPSGNFCFEKDTVFGRGWKTGYYRAVIQDFLDVIQGLNVDF